jgi:hypothetical protein
VRAITRPATFAVASLALTACKGLRSSERRTFSVTAASFSAIVTNAPRQCVPRGDYSVRTRTAVMFCFCALVAGCATAPPPVQKLNVTVTTFQQLPTQLSGTTFAMAPTSDQKDSLEYQAYKERVRDRLLAVGMREASNEQADFVVTFDYFIDNGQVHTVSIPVWGQTGVVGSTTTGTASVYGNSGIYNQTTTYTPSYGVTGFVPRSTTLYTRRLNVVIVDGKQLARGTLKHVYEANAVSVGLTGQLAIVAPIVITAVFEDFPGANGETRNVSLPCPDCAH